MRAAEAARRSPFEGLALSDGNRGAALTGDAIQNHLDRTEACQLEAFEHASALAAERASVAFYAQEGWLDAVRAGLVALLDFFEEEPKLARYLLAGSAQATDAVSARRREVIDRIAQLLDDERAPARGYPPPLTAHAVANGVLGVLSERLCRGDPGSLGGLAGPLMSFIVLPFLGPSAARRELVRPRSGVAAPDDGAVLDPLKAPGGRLNSRAVSALEVIRAEAGLTSKEVSSRTGVNDDAQMSRLLARLERLGLIENTRAAGNRFGRKSWRVTASGGQLREALEREAATPKPASAFALPPELDGSVPDPAVLMLRVIADQPWLRSSEVAERAGVQDGTEALRLLNILAGHGLAVSERAPRVKGSPRAWRLTPRGEELDRAIPRPTPAPARSLALDLMWRSGGRLNGNAISVLRVIGSEPGLSNNDIAARVGITDENTMSQLLARLARRELIENSRDGGRYNVWHLTPAGHSLERAIWHEMPPALQREHALHLLRGRGGRLTHRVVSVLQAIGSEPCLSNNEIAQRAGMDAKGHTSAVLARLARFGLIENTRTGGRENEWRLTPAGVDLAAAIRHEARSPQ